MLEQTVNEMQEDLIKMRQASAQARISSGREKRSSVPSVSV